MVSSRDLSVELGDCTVLERINMEVYAGEMASIIGPNGAGKTTLLRLMLGLLKPSRGKMDVLGKDPCCLGSRREDVGYLPQRPAVTPRFPLSVLDVVLMGLVTPGMMGKRFRGHQKQQARESLERVGLLSLQNRPFEQLSGGEKQRVFLARALVKEPRLLLLDEPHAGLDLPTRNRFTALLQQLQQEKCLTVVVVSHDLAAVAAFAERVFCINRTMHVHGSAAEVLESPHLGEAYRCEFDLLFNRWRSHKP